MRKYITVSLCALVALFLLPGILASTPAQEQISSNSIGPHPSATKNNDVLEALVEEVKTHLRSFGYFVGQVNGVIDLDLHRAVEKYRADRGFPGGDAVDIPLILQLRWERENPSQTASVDARSRRAAAQIADNSRVDAVSSNQPIVASALSDNAPATATATSRPDISAGAAAVWPDNPPAVPGVPQSPSVRELPSVETTRPPMSTQRPRANPRADVFVLEVQVLLRDLGLYRGPLDGLAGPMTHAAAEAFARSQGMRFRGITDELVYHLWSYVHGGGRLRQAPRGDVGSRRDSWSTSPVQSHIAQQAHTGSSQVGPAFHLQIEGNDLRFDGSRLIVNGREIGRVDLGAFIR